MTKESAILTYFKELCAIPHGSGHEGPISDYLLAFAKEHGLWAHRDDCLNVYMKKAGSKGQEQAPALLLQGHTDMVCEKNSTTVHDFLKDGLKLRREGDLLKATGTTLGADDGVAVAYMLALLADDTLRHPPLECLFTVGEEVGLEGAAAAELSLFSARRMINLDCEKEDEVVVSCAGGLRADIALGGERTAAAGVCLTAALSGLLGGHSGMDIPKERGNANKIAGRMLFDLTRRVQAGLCSFTGGEKDNAIPRECTFSVCVAKGDGAAAAELLRKTAEEVRRELQFDDPDFQMFLTETAAEGTMFTPKATGEMAELLFLVPNGVMIWSTQTHIPACSLNLGRVRTDETGILLTHALRGSMDSMKQTLKRQVAALAERCGATFEAGAEYPAWEYRKESPFRERYLAVYETLRGKKPAVVATHGGLECGIFAGKQPDLDIIAFGPDCSDVHTPEESLSLSSFARTFETLCKFIETL